MKTIFVSSTFKDMHYERDIIQDVVAPKINTVAKKYGESVSFCDLRWGIDTSTMEEETGAKKVLDVCLSEIDRCRPPFIVVLGYRYGWIPDNQLIENAASTKQLILDDLDLSVTALEIEYGALRSPERSQNTFFYFREIEGEAPEDYMSEDPEHAMKLNQLKKRIMQIAGDRVKTYTVTYNGSGFEGMRDFGDMIYEDISEYLSAEWECLALLSEYEREKIIHDNYMKEKATQFVARESIADNVIEEATASTEPYGIVAEPGQGKTTLLSYIINKLSEEGMKSIVIFGGLTSKACSGEGVLRMIISFLEKALEFEESLDDDGLIEFADNNDLDAKDRIGNLAAYYNALLDEFAARNNERIVIAIDAINQINSDECIRRYSLFPKRKPDNVIFLVSSEEEEDFGGIWGHSVFAEKSNDCADIVNGIVRANGRELDERVIKAITAKSNKTPLYMRLMVQRLSLMRQEDFESIRSLGDGMNAITEHQIEIVKNSPSKTGSLCAEIIKIASERINPSFVADAAALIAASNRGLRPNDLEAIMGDTYNSLDLAHFLSYMSENFIIRDDGRIDYSNRMLRNGFKGFNALRLERENHKRIYAYLKTLDLSDEICSSEIAIHLMRGYGINAHEELYALASRIVASGLTEPLNALIDKLHSEFSCSDSFGIDFINYMEENVTEDTWPVMQVIRKACRRCEKSEYKYAYNIMARMYEYERNRLGTEDNADIYMHLSDITYYIADFCACKENAEDDIVKCYLQSVKYAEKAHEIDNTKDVRNDVAAAYEQITRRYKDYFDYANQLSMMKPDDNKGLLDDDISEELKEILGFYLESIEIRRELYSEKKSSANGRKLISALADLGDFLSYSMDINRIEKLIRICKELYREALSVHEELKADAQIGKVYENSVAAYNIYRRVGCFLYTMAEDPVECINYLLKAYRIADGIYEKDKSLASLYRLAHISKKVGGQYRQSPVKEKLRKSVKFYRYAKEYRYKIYHITRTPDDFYCYGDARLELAEAIELCISENHDLGDNNEFIRDIQDELYEAKHIFDYLRDSRDYSGYDSELARLKLIDVARLLGGNKNDEIVNRLIEEIGHPYPTKTGKELAYAYAELLELMNYMDNESRSKVTIGMIKLLERNRDRSYVNHMDPNKTLAEQDLSSETATLLINFTMAYWANTDSRMLIKEKLDENEREFRENQEGTS